MNKTLLYTTVGGLVLFIWQFLSFAAVNLHGNSQEYTPKDKQILKFLASIELEEGMYALGSPSPEERSDPALQESYMRRMEGQPWARLNYRHHWSGDMSMNLIRSVIMNMLSAFLLFWLFRNVVDRNTGKCVMIAVAVGWVGFLFFPYSNFIWFKDPDIWAHMVDATVPFAMLGWLGSRWA